jgi:hypothetical protein
MEANRLFEIVDKTSEVNTKAAEFDAAADAAAAALFAAEHPAPSLSSACRRCDFFPSECLGAGIEHSVLELPSLHPTKLKKLGAIGVIGLLALPEDFELTDRQKRVKDSVASGDPFKNPDLLAALQALQWPCHYLDFETVATTLPLYENHACHQQVLTQFSIHHLARLGAELTHSEFLADATRDDQRTLAVRLIEALGTEGSIVVYGTFEKTRITAMQTMFPDLSEQLGSILVRLVNLNAIVTDNVYFPAFRGSSSIKNVLPVLVPELSYEGLAIADGDTAITRFARMARKEIAGADIEVTRAQLLEYCKLDTLGMVRLHEALLKLGN